MAAPIIPISKIPRAGAIPQAGVDAKIAAGWIPDLSGVYSVVGHNHDSRYYTETEVDTLLAGYQPVGSYQPLDSDLTTFAALAPSNGSFLRRTGGAWVGAALVAADIPDLSVTYLVPANIGVTVQGFDANTTILGNTITGTGAIVRTTSPTIVTPTIASLINAQHSHQNAAGGGSLDAAAIGSGTLADARLSANIVTLTGIQTLTNKSIAATQLTGTLQAAQFPALTGDVTSAAGALAATLATVNSNVGSFDFPSITVNAKGLITAVATTVKLGLARGGTNADLSGTGGANQVLKQVTLGGNITVGQLANTDISGLGTMSVQNAVSVAITGGTIDGTPIGGSTPAAGSFTTITGNNLLSVVGSVSNHEIRSTATAAGGVYGLLVRVTNNNFPLALRSPGSWLIMLRESDGVQLGAMQNTTISGSGNMLGVLGSAGVAFGTTAGAYYLAVRAAGTIIADSVLTNAPAARLHIRDGNAATNTVVNSLIVGLNSTGTAAAGFGAALVGQLASSTTADQLATRLRWFWNTATHASRKAYAVLSAYDTAERDVIGIGADGSNPLLGFYNIATAPIAKQTVTGSRGSNAALASLLTALAALGLITDSSS